MSIPIITGGVSALCMAAAGQYEKSSITHVAAYATPFILNAIPYLLGLSSLPVALAFTALSIGTLLISENLSTIQQLFFNPATSSLPQKKPIGEMHTYQMRLNEAGQSNYGITLSFEGAKDLTGEGIFTCIEQKLKETEHYNPATHCLRLVALGKEIKRTDTFNVREFITQPDHDNRQLPIYILIKPNL